MRIALLGDIALFGRCTTPEYFKEISEYLSEFDYVVGNLETPFSEKKKTYGAKSAYICAEPSCVNLLKLLHINAVTLANNHMFDYGSEGYETTKRLLQENGIDWFGTEGKEIRFEKDDCKIVLSGYCCFSTNPLKCVKSGGYGVNEYNIKQVRRKIKQHDKEGFLNIVAVHAGVEHVNYPSIDHVKAARLLARRCPYVYYGHHPHVIQGVEEHNGSLIAHSLGNFCFDDVYTDHSTEPLVTLTENNRTGMILELTIENNRVTGWKEQIILIYKNEGIAIGKSGEGINKYNNALIGCEGNAIDYTVKRNRIISNRLKERKNMRNLSWYLKRLRPRYIQIILNARNNAKKYRENVTNYIK